MTFTDETNTQHTTLAVIGENNVHLIEGRSLGFSRITTPQGNATEWLRKGIMQALESAEAPADKKVKGK